MAAAATVFAGDGTADFQIEAAVGERHVLLEDRPLADPGAQPLRKDQRRIAEAKQVIEKRAIAVHGRHRCFTSSGIGKNVGWR